MRHKTKGNLSTQIKELGMSSWDLPMPRYAAKRTLRIQILLQQMNYLAASYEVSKQQGTKQASGNSRCEIKHEHNVFTTLYLQQFNISSGYIYLPK